MEITAISSIGNLDMIALKPHQVVMSCELEDAESFYRFWAGLAYDRIMIQVITTGSFIEDLSEYFEGHAYKVTKLVKGNSISNPYYRKQTGILQIFSFC